jgi:predicted DNA-binding protein
MEVHLKPETESRLNEVAFESGRPTGELVEGAMAGYLAEVDEVRSLLEHRCEDIQSGRAKPIDDEAFFADLRQREEKLLKRQPLN